MAANPSESYVLELQETLFSLDYNPVRILGTEAPEEFHKRISKAQAIQDKRGCHPGCPKVKTPKKYIYDSKASLTAEQTVAVALGYSKDEYGAYQYPTNDEIERSYEFQTALRAEIRKRTQRKSSPTWKPSKPGS